MYRTFSLYHKPEVGAFLQHPEIIEFLSSTPASAEVKKMWIYISTPPYAFME
jgi:hypothetical protein